MVSAPISFLSLRAASAARLLAALTAALVAGPAGPGGAAPPAPGRAPRLLAPGVISTRDYERDGTFTPDGRTFYFTKRTIWPFFSAICVSYWRDGRWTAPEVAPFSGRYPDATPFVSPDGAKLYIASRRPVGAAAKRDYDLWVMDRVGAGWGEPRVLPAPVNGPGNELSPAVTRDGTLYFVGGAQLPRVMRTVPAGDGWQPPVAVADPADSSGVELNAYVSPDDRYMIVSVIGREDELHSAEAIYPRADLYVRERRAGAWSRLRHLPEPINSAAEEGSPTVTPDGRTFVFTSERGRFTAHGTRPLTYAEFEQGLHTEGNGLGDIYEVDVATLGLTP